MVLGALAATPASAAEIRGTVRQSGAWVVDAPVALYRRYFMSLQLVGASRSDDEGRYAFIDLAAGEYFVATNGPDGGNRYLPGNLPCVYADRCLIRTVSGGITLDAMTVVSAADLQPDVAAVASGRVLAAEDGVPIVNALVTADGGMRSTRTDGKGRFRLGGFNPGRIGLRATAPGRIGRIYPNFSFDPLVPDSFNEPLTLVAGENPNLVFSLSQGARLRGSLRSASSGTGVHDVVLYRANGGQSISRVPTVPCAVDAVASNAACFDVDGLFPGTFTLAFATLPLANHVPSYWRDMPCAVNGCSPGNGTPIEVAAGQTIDNLHATVQPRRWISGTVRAGINGPPTAGAWVIAMRPLGPPAFGAAAQIDRQLSNAAGQFVLDNLPEGPIDVIVRGVPDRLDQRWPAEDCGTENGFCARGPAPGRIAVPAAGEVGGIDFALADGAQIAGVVDVVGEGPTAGVLVTLGYKTTGSSATIGTTLTDIAGRYRFAGLQTNRDYYLAAQRQPIPGIVFYPDRWCVGAPCPAFGQVPVTINLPGTVTANLLMPADPIARDGFEAVVVATPARATAGFGSISDR